MNRLLVPLFTVTIFSSALLLFIVQPLFARLLLPRLGGSAAVWNTALVFYQAALLAGYAYAHLTTRWLGVRRQVVLHCVVILLPLLVLPVAIPRDWVPPTHGNPIPWLLGLMTITVGLPVFVVSATSPLLQRWFAASGHVRAADPYFLYSASNLGSLVALLAYPVLIEPRLGLARQSHWWSVGYGGLVILIALCGWRSRRTTEPVTVPRAAAPLTWRRRGRWLLLAGVPASLLFSVTTYMTSVIAPVPLLWVLPLGAYLLTFVLVFARRRWVSHKWIVRAVPVVVAAVLWKFIRVVQGVGGGPVDWLIALHLTGLFIVGLACHGELANDRPAESQLTEFYLWLAGGGMLGGVFNAVLAPVIFPTVFEYPLTLLVACALLPRPAVSRWKWIARVHWPAVLALSLAVWFAFQVGPRGQVSNRIFRGRNFFGIHQVLAVSNFHYLTHGNTTHGIQSLDPARRREPLAYYARSGPVGDIMKATPPPLRQRVAVVGLGAGTMACYAEAGQHWTFYEIDPLVEQIARDPRYFTFLADCPAAVAVVLGDARLSLEHVPDGQYDLIILDAYASDTLPLHLITREALALYLRKLSPTGQLVFHISTRHLDLKTVFANLAADAGLLALHKNDFAGAEIAQGKQSSHWLVMAREVETLQPVADSGYWRQARPDADVRVWTDDYASLFQLWSWR